MADESSANVIAQLVSTEGDTAGPQLDLPVAITPAQLETVLHGLLPKEEDDDGPKPYAFFINDQELSGELGEFLTKHQVSVEGVLRIVFQPQALFRVRAVTRCSAAMAGHTESVLAVQFSPDGKRLASGSGDSTVRTWDLNTQLPLHQGTGHKSWVLCVAYSPDGSMLASGGMDSDVRLWDPEKGTAIGGVLKGHKQWVTSLAWEPANLSFPTSRLASASKDCTVRIWDTRLKRCLLVLGVHTKAVSHVKWGGSGLLYTCSQDTTINVWETTEGKLVRQLKGHGHWVNTLGLSTEHALRTGPFDHTGQPPPTDPTEAKALAQKRYDELKGTRGERLVSGSDDFTMFLWEPEDGKKPLARMTGHQQLINQVQFSPNGLYICSASFDKSVKLWDGLSGKFLASFFGHVGPVYQVSWSADSRLIVSGSKDSTLKVWDLRTRKLKMDLPGHADEVFSVDWSPDGWRIASGGKDRMLRIWRH